MADLAFPSLAVWAALVAAFTLLWAASLVLKNASIVDMWWGPAFVPAAALYAGDAPAVGARALAVLGVVALWAVRLAWHIGRRNVGHGEDPRYAAWRVQHGTRWWWRSWFQVFLLQATVAWLVSWPIAAAMRSGPEFPTAWDAAGLAVALAGLLIETVADAQLRRFKRTAPRGAVCDVGLWRYSRHPNYFGESLVWWGLFLVACAVPGGWVSVVSPVLITWLLLRVSGVTMLEAGLAKTKPGYAEYVRRTSAFVPWPPAR
jgi:steroid 5-alpha reductase family enzyme